MVSKACLVGTYQTKLEQIGQQEDVELAVVVPPVWLDPAGPVRLERAHTAGYTLWVDPIRFNGQYHFHYYPKLSQRIAQFKPDIVHMDEEPYNLATFMGVRQARAAGAKTLFFTWQNLYRRYPIPFRWLESYVLNHVDYALMGNQAAVEVFRRKGYAADKPHKVIPQFGVAEALFVPPPHGRDPNRSVIIGAAGRLVPEKGLDILLQAVARLAGNWRLHLAGDGPARPSLEKLAHDLGIRERVFFDGALPSTEMPTYLSQLDILVLPSRTRPNWQEQFGRILVEAMACETAVVGSETGEIPHVIGEAGLTFPEGDVTALHAHLQNLIQQPHWRQELGRAGRARVLANYTQGQIATQTTAV
ncbi:MAG: glycosyltransferase family 4 protein, partial [Anaerolineales bacterium]|nr:glycosyltransferase family 4 protein [Anaerolineales bacterium]